MNLQDKPVEQIRWVAGFLNETSADSSPPSEAKWREICHDLRNVATFLEAFTVPEMESPIVRHEYKQVLPRPPADRPKPATEQRPIAVFGREEALTNGANSAP